jgi:DNA-directed RNA polymerase subunit alpha
MKPISIFCITSRVETNRSYYAQFQLGPFEVGQGITVANSLRRSLLSELPGLAITEVEIPGIKHEYSTLPGLRESVLELLLNLRQIVLCSEFCLKQPKFGYINFNGPGIIRATDIHLPCYIKSVDPEQYIATVTYDAVFCVKFLICQGNQKLSKVPSRLTWPNREVENLFILKSSNQSKKKSTTRKQNKIDVLKKNGHQMFETKQNHTLPLDAVFMPVTKVNYLIEIDPSEGGQPFTDRVILELWTNGSIHPRQAIHQAAQNLVNLFVPLREPQIIKTLLPLGARSGGAKKWQKKKLRSKILRPSYLKPDFLDIDIANLDLSSRSYTCLKRANINLIKDLTLLSKQQLFLIKNFSLRACEDVEKALNFFGLNLANQNEA